MVECTNPDCGAPLANSDVTRAGRCRYCGEMAAAPDSAPTHPETPRAKTASQDQPAASLLEAIACWSSELSPEGQQRVAMMARRLLDEEQGASQKEEGELEW